MRVDVRIIDSFHSDKADSDCTELPDLMEAGVKIFEYTPGFITAKIVADDGICCGRDGALTIRSLVHHYENAVPDVSYEAFQLSRKILKPF